MNDDIDYWALKNKTLRKELLAAKQENEEIKMTEKEYKINLEDMKKQHEIIIDELKF